MSSIYIRTCDAGYVQSGIQKYLSH